MKPKRVSVLTKIATKANNLSLLITAKIVLITDFLVYKSALKISVCISVCIGVGESFSKAKMFVLYGFNVLFRLKKKKSVF